MSSNIHRVNENHSNCRQERTTLYFHVYVELGQLTVQVRIVVSCGPNGWDFIELSFHRILSYDTFSKTDLYLSLFKSQLRRS